MKWNWHRHYSLYWCRKFQFLFFCFNNSYGVSPFVVVFGWKAYACYLRLLSFQVLRLFFLTLIRDDSTVTGVCKWMQSTTFQQFVFVMLMQECSIFCHISHITFLWYLYLLPGGKNSRVKWKLLSIVTFRDFWLLREKYWNDSFFELRIKIWKWKWK